VIPCAISPLSTPFHFFPLGMMHSGKCATLYDCFNSTAHSRTFTLPEWFSQRRIIQSTTELTCPTDVPPSFCSSTHEVNRPLNSWRVLGSYHTEYLFFSDFIPPDSPPPTAVPKSVPASRGMAAPEDLLPAMYLCTNAVAPGKGRLSPGDPVGTPKRMRAPAVYPLFTQDCEGTLHRCVHDMYKESATPTPPPPRGPLGRPRGAGARGRGRPAVQEHRGRGLPYAAAPPPYPLGVGVRLGSCQATGCLGACQPPCS